MLVLFSIVLVEYVGTLERSLFIPHAESDLLSLFKCKVTQF